MNRRNFLGLVATAATVAATASARPTTRRSIRKAVKIDMVQVPGELEAKLRTLARLGFDGVELNSPGNLDPAMVRAAVEATGVEIPGVVDAAHWDLPLSHPDPKLRSRGREALEAALRECKAFGGSTVLLVPAVVNAEVGYREAYERSQEQIRRVLPLAAELEVKIAIENVWNQFLLSPLEAARYVDELESPWVGWYLDTGNVVTHGWPEDWVRVLGHRILRIDVKDFSRRIQNVEGRSRAFVGIGEGDCNWPAIMAALDEIGFDGWAVAEVPGGDEARLREIAGRMDRVLNS